MNVILLLHVLMHKLTEGKIIHALMLIDIHIMVFKTDTLESLTL